eukprot:6473058-Lingulodinium_polyedra.AAC.1
MARLGHLMAAALTLIMTDGYLRPGEVPSLTPSSFVAPTPHARQQCVVLLHPADFGKPGKAGVFDDTIPFDSGRLQWMWP